MTRVPKLSVGLPVYNGQNYLAESIEALLGQSYEDFELIISDNASTDDTADICHRYEKDDPRIRYFRQEHNIGGAPNHNFLVAQARGELFKWASHDDLYGRDLLKRCVDALEEFPRVILAHSWTALIDASGAITKAVRYGLATSSPSAPERFRSMLYEVGGDDDGGVIRMDVLRRAPLVGSYYHSDRTQVAGMALYGPFYHVPDWLYFEGIMTNGQNGRSRPPGPGVPTWTRAGPMRCATRPSACTPNTSGDTSARSTGLPCRPPTSARATGTWPAGCRPRSTGGPGGARPSSRPPTCPFPRSRWTYPDGRGSRCEPLPAPGAGAGPRVDCSATWARGISATTPRWRPC